MRIFKLIGLILSFILLTIALVQILNTLFTSATYLDSYAYWGAANLFKSGISPYFKEFESSTHLVNYFYPPASLYFFGLISFIPIHYGQVVLTLLSIASLIATVFLTFKLIDKKVDIWKQILISSFLLQTFPVKLTLALGQINLIVLFLAVFSIYLLKKKKVYISAIFLTIASSFKLTPLGIIPIFLYKKKYRWVFLVILVFLIINLLNPTLFLEYLTNVIPNYWSENIWGASLYNQSLTALVFRITNWPYSPKVASAIFTFIYLLLFLAAKKDSPYSSATAFLALMSIYPQNAWQHHLVLAYPFIILYFRKPSIFILIWIFLAFHFTQNYPIVDILPLIGGYQTILVLILLGWYIYRRISR